MKVLGLAGSPRVGGNTALLLEQALAGAAEQGAAVEKIFLNRLKIRPCQHCDGCLSSGQCVVKDDMLKLHQQLRELDRLILASPIFFLGVTAQTKAMIDRCQALWVLKYRLKLKVATHSNERKGLFISTAGFKRPDIFEPAIRTVKAWFKSIDVVYADELLFNGIDEKGDITHHPTALHEAFLAGQRLVADP
ncbi:MAG: flavodoxin family protein [Chloroflexi bacterium]|nr:flavodoxin family protein [Chloroflexota bacterium]MCL5075943.1 flavodoxin family protein [Chloroflexota bacterium]